MTYIFLSDSLYLFKILYHPLYSGHVEIWRTLEAHQGPWGHQKTDILDLGGKNEYWEQPNLLKSASFN